MSATSHHFFILQLERHSLNSIKIIGKVKYSITENDGDLEQCTTFIATVENIHFKFVYQLTPEEIQKKTTDEKTVGEIRKHFYVVDRKKAKNDAWTLRKQLCSVGDTEHYGRMRLDLYGTREIQDAFQFATGLYCARWYECAAFECAMNTTELVDGKFTFSTSFDELTIPNACHEIKSDISWPRISALTFSTNCGGVEGQYEIWVCDDVTSTVASSVTYCLEQGTNENERWMFSKLFSLLKKYDPDIVLGHGMLNRCVGGWSEKVKAFNQRNQWMNLGRIQGVATLRHGIQFPFIAGRLYCDTERYAKANIEKVSSYQLKDLFDWCHTINGANDGDEMNRNALSFAITLNVIPSALETARLTRCPIDAVMRYERSTVVEWLLLHKFVTLNCIPPSFHNTTTASSNMEEKGDASGGESTTTETSYVGGLVLDSKRGVYKESHIKLLDFKSLYPSIILKYQISFPVEQCDAAEPPSDEKIKSILPRIVKKFLDRREEVRRQIALLSNDGGLLLRTVLQIREKLFKLFANSLYGCLGFHAFRFYSRRLAEQITERGREILSQSVAIVENEFTLPVIAGDTDSIMIDTKNADTEEAIQIASKICNRINEQFTPLEIRVDGSFERALIIRKKFYATMRDALAPVLTKGIETRKYCRWTKTIVIECIRLLLTCSLTESDDETEVRLRAILQPQLELLTSGDALSSSDFILSVALSKNLNQYIDRLHGKPTKHVLVAKEVERRCGVQFIQKDIVQFIVVGREEYVAADWAIENVKPIDAAYYYQKQLRSLFDQCFSFVRPTTIQWMDEFVEERNRDRRRRNPFLFTSSTASSQAIQTTAVSTSFEWTCSHCSFPQSFNGTCVCVRCSEDGDDNPLTLDNITRQFERFITECVARCQIFNATCSNPTCRNHSTVDISQPRAMICNKAECGSGGWPLHLEFDGVIFLEQINVIRFLIEEKNGSSGGAVHNIEEQRDSLPYQDAIGHAQLFNIYKRLLEINANGVALYHHSCEAGILGPILDKITTF